MAADVPGTVYLICFPGGIHCTGNRYASHYLGWCNLGEHGRRFSEHLRGQGSPLVKAAVNAGMTPVLSRIWHDVTRNDERRMKHQHNLARYCPNCVAKTGRKLAHLPRGIDMYIDESLRTDIKVLGGRVFPIIDRATARSALTYARWSVATASERGFSGEQIKAAREQFREGWISRLDDLEITDLPRDPFTDDERSLI